MHGYALYQAMRMNGGKPPARCCSDEPPPEALSRLRRHPVRWHVRLSRAVPGSIRVALAALREPAHAAAPDVGAMVVRRDGTRVGHVSDVLVSLGSGAKSLSIRPAEGPDGHVILMPSAQVEPSGERDVFVTRDLSTSYNAA